MPHRIPSGQGEFAGALWKALHPQLFQVSMYPGLFHQLAAPILNPLDLSCGLPSLHVLHIVAHLWLQGEPRCSDWHWGQGCRGLVGPFRSCVILNMSLNFLILKTPHFQQEHHTCLHTSEVSVKLEEGMVVTGLIRLIRCKQARVLVLLPLPTHYALATWHGRGQSLCR